MNTYNHHRIIDELAQKVDVDKDVLIKASDYTDDFVLIGVQAILQSLNSFPKGFSVAKLLSTLRNNLTQKKYYYYHFYYDIECENDTIVLKRENSISIGDESKIESYKQSVDRCEYDPEDFSVKPGDYDYMMLVSELSDSPVNYKKFFNTINDREDIRKNYFENHVNKSGFIDKIMAKKFDSSNQSDCVAFLHAMGSWGEGKADSLKAFKNHIINCFAEYLFLQDPEQSEYMLGIALHSIMDSFTPSHTGFKNYVEQDMALHAQGDVIPFEGDPVYFDPGQCLLDAIASKGQTLAAALVKGYNCDNNINNTEYSMLYIFIDSFLGANSKTNALKTMAPDSLLSLNVQFWLDKYHYYYNNEAVEYSNSAIEVLVAIYDALKKEKDKCRNNYDYYKEAKKKLENFFVQNWQEKYNRIQNFKGSERLQYINPKTAKPVVLDYPTIDDFVSDSTKAIKKSVAYAKEKLKQYVSDYLLDKAESLADSIDVTMDDIEAEIDQHKPELKNSISEKCNKVIKKAHEIIDTADHILEEVDQRVNVIKQEVDKVLHTATAVCDTIKGAATGVKQAAEYILSNIDEYASTLSKTVNTTISSASNLVTQAQQTVTNFTQTAFTTAMNTVDKFSGIANGTCENVKGAAAKVISITNTAQEKLGKYLPSSWFDKVRGAANTISNTVDGVQSKVNQVTEIASDAINQAHDKIQKEADKIANEAQQMLSNVQQQANGLITTAQQEAKSILNVASDTCDQLIEQSDAIKSMINEMQSTADKYKGVYDSLKQKVSDYLAKVDNVLDSVQGALDDGSGVIVD